MEDIQASSQGKAVLSWGNHCAEEGKARLSMRENLLLTQSCTPDTQGRMSGAGLKCCWEEGSGKNRPFSPMAPI